MSRTIRRRLLQALPVLWGVATLVFLMLYVVPGDPVALMLSSTPSSPELAASLRAAYGLDQPIHLRYLDYLGDLARGDLGTSITYGRSVAVLLLEQLPATLQLAFAGIVLGVVLGIVLGSIAAFRRDTWVDRLCMLVATLGISMPSFWFGILLIALFSFTLGWLPATGTAGVERLVMPALVLGLGSGAAIARLVRASVLEELSKEYVQAAYAKGMGRRAVLYRHALRNGLIPVVTVIGLHFGTLLGGAVVTETIFARQGLGRLAMQSVLAKDLPLVEGVVLLAALVYVLVNLAVDISYAALDPRSSS